MAATSAIVFRLFLEVNLLTFALHLWLLLLEFDRSGLELTRSN